MTERTVLSVVKHYQSDNNERCHRKCPEGAEPVGCCRLFGNGPNACEPGACESGYCESPATGKDAVYCESNGLCSPGSCSSDGICSQCQVGNCMEYAEWAGAPQPEIGGNCVSPFDFQNHHAVLPDENCITLQCDPRIPDKCEKCKDKYFISPHSRHCKPCSPTCNTCKEDADNCLTCDPDSSLKCWKNNTCFSLPDLNCDSHVTKIITLE